MMATLTERYYPAVPQWKHLERLAVFSPGLDAREPWIELHEGVQEQLAALESDVRQSMSDVRVTSGSTRGKMFLLFSYRTFSLPDSDIDPVVAGVTLTQTDQGVNVEGDVTGEQTGDMIFSPPKRMTPNSHDELLATARESARQLSQSARAIVTALNNPSRGVK